MQPNATPTHHDLAYRAADFETLTDALDYAAQGETGSNFYTGRGEIYASISYADLRQQSQMLARKLLGLGLHKGDRVALVAETDPEFIRFFYACQYAGLIPVALPASVKVGAHSAYVAQLQRLLEASDAAIGVASEGYLPFLQEASEDLAIRMVEEPEAFHALPDTGLALPEVKPTDIAYIQYTSGSTRFPRGVVIEHQTAMANLQAIMQGLEMGSDDRMMSWLPYYHDMGLVGFVLVPMSAQVSIDYLDTREFAMRPRQWLNLMTKTRATISFAPSFGYDLCARRVRPADLEQYDLSSWRVAGIGAEMIRPQTLEHFADMLETCGFDRRAFLACYGMAECTLGISFSPLNTGFTTHHIDSDHLADHHEAVLLEESENSGRGRHFVNCGYPLPGFDVEVRDDDGKALPDWHSGVIYLRGPSVMSGYFGLPEETSHALCEDGWLNTGDIGYLADGIITITGRKKDLIIIHGRNIWPQDLEHIAESQPEVRVGDALAFSAPDHEGDELCVLVVQCRETDPNKRNNLVRRLTALVRMELSLDCYVELVAPHSLPRTSSGKLSRSKARQDFIAAHDNERLNAVAEEVRLRVATA
ncbi:MAG: fatty acyl-AMP ligase [Halieaceae bacterium]|nr:fatty acyl-AMP ligase [Halieaceae bacterium]